MVIILEVGRVRAACHAKSDANIKIVNVGSTKYPVSWKTIAM